MFPNHSSFDAVIFDLDGVLVDTEPLVWDVYREIFAGQGISLTHELEAATVGLDMPTTADLLLGKTGLDWTPEQLIDRHLTRLYERFERELLPFDGAVDLTRRLHAAGLPLAVASNSPVDYVRRVLRAIGIGIYLQTAIGCDLVPRPKPFPDVYLGACSRLNVDPFRCLAVEDSAVGLQAALAAGMSVAWIHAPIPDLPPKVWRFNALTDIAKELFRT